MYCKKCGRQQIGNERFCAECGTPYTKDDNIRKTANMTPPNIPMSASAYVPDINIASGFGTHTHEGEKRCPNCGANYTNTKNCEYCGSLLVRFVEKNIEIDQNKYGETAEKLTGLEQALKENLQDQEDAEGTYHVVTFVGAPMLYATIDVCSPMAIKDMVKYEIFDSIYTTLPSNVVQSENISLLVCFRFFEVDNFYRKNKINRFNSDNKIQLERFRQMKEFALFTYTEESLYELDGACCGKLHSYYIDFGKDYNGAATIITQYMREVHNVKAIKKINFTYRLSSISDEDYTANISSTRKEIKHNRLEYRLWPLYFLLGIGYCYVIISGLRHEPILFLYHLCIVIVVFSFAIYGFIRCYKDKF